MRRNGLGRSWLWRQVVGELCGLSRPTRDHKLIIKESKNTETDTSNSTKGLKLTGTVLMLSGTEGFDESKPLPILVAASSLLWVGGLIVVQFVYRSRIILGALPQALESRYTAPKLEL